MLTAKVMESSGDYNNHFVTIKDEDTTIFSECLIGFNNTLLAVELRGIVMNQQPEAIEQLDVYGYSGELSNKTIIPKLIKYNEEH